MHGELGLSLVNGHCEIEFALGMHRSALVAVITSSAVLSFIPLIVYHFQIGVFVVCVVR